MVRILGGATAAIALLLSALVLYSALTTSDRVLPTDGVIGGTPDPAVENAAAYDALVQRAQLQRWRGETGPAPEAEAASPAASPRPEAQAPGERYALWLSRAEEQEALLREREFVQGTTAVAGPVREVFMQPRGRTWRAFRNDWIFFGGGLYIFGVGALLAGFLAWRGRIRVAEGQAGESVPRFGAFERANHWMTAISFVLLALTGLVILYGSSLIRPWLGAGAFADLAEASVWLHMALVPPFALGLLAMLALWTLHNLPRRVDWEWLKQGGGMASEDSPNPPAPKFNAGQKLIFWFVVLGGLALLASGVTLMFPFLWAGYDGMAVAQSLHSIAALLMIGLIIAHIYIGTVGMEGAFAAMWSGRVDRNWAKEHHSLWFDELVRRGEARPEPGGQAAARRGGGSP